jgi:RNA polymerase primary sigma factor
MIKEFKISHSITERTPILSSYMQDISRYPLLTLDEEVELTQRAKAGDESAKQQLIQCNLRFVISVAKQFVHQGVALEDLIMEGNIGLINAIDKFDPTRGFKLSTYAVWWIRQSILQSLAEKGRAVRMPLNQVGLHMRVRRAAQTFLQTHERPPMPDELAELLGLPEEKVKEVMNNAAVEFSIDKPISDDSEMSYADTLESSTPASDTIVQQESLCTDIQRWLMVLENDRARDIMQRSFGLNGMAIMSLEELAAKYRLSRERVRQIQQQALQTLRNHVPSYIY